MTKHYNKGEKVHGHSREFYANYGWECKTKGDVAANLAFKAMDVAGGGLSFSSINWGSRGTTWLEVKSAQMGVEQIILAVFTRWECQQGKGRSSL